jgi:hypothetical protein
VTAHVTAGNSAKVTLVTASTFAWCLTAIGDIWYNTRNNERRQMATVDVCGIRIIPNRLGLNDNLTKMLEKAPDDRYKFAQSSKTTSIELWE